jgi:hypothetical protein
MAKKRICIYCKEDISHLHHSYTVCLNPKCRKRFEIDRKKKMKESQQRYYEKNKSYLLGKSKSRPVIPSRNKARYCRICGKKIKNGNWFLCKSCHGFVKRSNEQRIDGDWLYA